MEELLKLLPVIIPLLVIDLGLIIFALVDLARIPKTKHFDKLIWALIIIFVSTFGPIIYFILGRETNYEDGSDDE